MSEKKRFRAAFGIAAPCCAAAVLYAVYVRGGLIPCPVYSLTGLYCAGCGSGRALAALLHLHVADAAGYNILFLILLPFLVYYALKEYLRVVTGRDVLPFFRIGRAAGIVMITLLIVFNVLRNLPWHPFIINQL